MGLTSRFAWWVKAVAIVVTSVFFVEAFYATKGLLGWPARNSCRQHFQLLWARAVEPDAKVGDPGAIYLWVEETRREQRAERRAALLSPAVFASAGGASAPRRATRS